ncbi:MAG: hypothetical protein U0795_16145 [Pirellulales bacterium]
MFESIRTQTLKLDVKSKPTSDEKRLLLLYNLGEYVAKAIYNESSVDNLFKFDEDAGFHIVPGLWHLLAIDETVSKRRKLEDFLFGSPEFWTTASC